MSAIVAKVMNSTVGTSAVKALDTILKESDAANVEKLNTYMTTIANNAADRLYNKLKSDVRLVGSDEVLFKYNGTWSLTSNDRYLTTTQGVSFSHSGTVIAKTVQNSDRENQFTVFTKGADGSTTELAVETNDQTDEWGYVEISASFNVVPGQLYYFKIYTYETNGIKSLDLCATPYPFGATATIS